MGFVFGFWFFFVFCFVLRAYALTLRHIPLKQLIFIDIEAILKAYQHLIAPKLEHVIPRQYTKELMTKLYGAARYEYDDDAITHAISVPVWDILDRGALCAQQPCRLYRALCCNS